jgi:hypothetical protein
MGETPAVRRSNLVLHPPPERLYGGCVIVTYIAAIARIGSIRSMTTVTETLQDVLARAQSWPEADQAELVELAHEIEACRAGGYNATADEQVEAVFRKHRRAISHYSFLYNSTERYRNPKD